MSKVTGFIVLLFTMLNVHANPTPAIEPLAEQDPKLHFVDNTQCVSCHREQAKKWGNSHHAKAMMQANEQAVKGNFNNTKFRHHGVISTFFRTGDGFFVNTVGPDGKFRDFKISSDLGRLA